MKYGGGSSGEEEGICLGADTRATGGPIVADKNCEKVGHAVSCLSSQRAASGMHTVHVAILTGLRSITSLLVYDVVELEQLRTPSETRPLLYCD